MERGQHTKTNTKYKNNQFDILSFSETNSQQDHQKIEQRDVTKYFKTYINQEMKIGESQTLFWGTKSFGPPIWIW